eukprot:2232815-Pyramimonas_sp.AAC.1
MGDVKPENDTDDDDVEGSADDVAKPVGVDHVADPDAEFIDAFSVAWCEAVQPVLASLAFVQQPSCTAIALNHMSLVLELTAGRAAGPLRYFHWDVPGEEGRWVIVDR